MESFTAAFDAGLDGIETDVQRSRDGVLLLHHDPVLADGRFIAHLSLAEIRGEHPRVALLAELLDLMAVRPGKFLNLEVKTDAPFEDARPAELAAAIAKLPEVLRRRIWVSSFDPVLLWRFHAAGPGVPLAFLAYHAPALALLAGLPVAAVHPHHSLVNAQRMRGWREQGLNVFTWTVNDEQLAGELLALGVDGLVGDDPPTLLDARTRHRTSKGN